MTWPFRSEILEAQVFWTEHEGRGITSEMESTAWHIELITDSGSFQGACFLVCWHAASRCQNKLYKLEIISCLNCDFLCTKKTNYKLLKPFKFIFISFQFDFAFAFILLNYKIHPHQFKCRERKKNVLKIWTWRYEKQFPFEFPRRASQGRRSMTLLRLARDAKEKLTARCCDNFPRVRFAVMTK